MTSRYSVTFNGNSMSAINSNLLILDVSYDEPEYGITVMRSGGGNGARIIGRYKEAARVTITFELHIYSITGRQTACQDVVKWAKGVGILVINDRPNQRLCCLCEEFPSVTSVQKWTEPLAITFVAYELPWWEDATATTLTLTGTSASGNLAVPGNAGDARVSVAVTAAAEVTTFTVTVGSTHIQLTGLSLSSGQTVEIGYTEEMLIYIKLGNASLMGKRTANSSDELLAASGATSTAEISADGSISAVFSVRGCWM